MHHVGEDERGAKEEDRREPGVLEVKDRIHC
jgi:hypothetical protein